MPATSLLLATTPPAGHFDEVRGPDGALRPAWAVFARTAGDLTPESLGRSAQRIARQIHENGVTYNVYAAADGPSRPWSLDVLPALIDADEWAILDGPLRQHARLMNALATDLYGPQHLVREGYLPARLVASHPGFLRACHGARPAGGMFAHVLAFDLARGPNGAWHLVGTRAQAPSGLGYVLENRAIIARLFPDALRAIGGGVLTPFFDALQDMLVSLAPSDGEAPHIVLLTPGPFNETYFEHAYLARELGLPLVQGGDLVVRHDRVFLKTVSGLRRVHGIWRRQDDDYCDPLELRAESTLGVPGLLHAWRSGHVLVANAFGLGMLESPALPEFLPGICQRLFGEPLALSVPRTWWCGDARGRGDALSHLATGLLKPVWPDPSRALIFGDELDADARLRWTARIDARPYAYAVQEALPFSHAPSWHDGRLESRTLMLRVFLVADGRGDYRVLHGGLTRVASDHRQIVSGQRGGNSKDTWIASHPSSGSEAWTDTTVRRRETPATERTTSSRAAEHLYWLGRYAERSENAARLIRSVLRRVAEAPAMPVALRACVFRACVAQGLIPMNATGEPSRGSRPLAEELTLESVTSALLTGLTDVTSGGLAYSIAETWRVASAVRERLSSDNWRVLNRLSQDRPEHEASHLGLDAALEYLDDMIVSLVAIGGLEMAHMTRDDGWRFLSLGRHLERLSFVAGTLGDLAAARATSEPAVLEWLLDVTDSLITYRARHLRQPEWPAVVGLLLFDERNPRSAMFQVGKVAKQLRLLPGAGLMDVLGDLDALHGAGRASDSEQGDLFGGSMTLESLPRLCERLAARVSDALTRQYFSHAYDLAHASVRMR